MPSKPSNPQRERIATGLYRRPTRDGVVYEVAFRDSGNKQRWRTVEKLADARALRADLVVKVARGEQVVPSKLTLAEFVADWLPTQTHLRPKTHDLYSTYLRLHVLPRLGRKRLAAVTVDDVAALIGDLAKGERFVEKDGRVERVEGKPFAAWTIRGVLVVMGRVFSSATRSGAISSNPVPLHYRNVVRRGLDKGIEASGVPRLRWHDLRHVAASALIEQGTDPVALARMLGHSNAAVTLSTYAHEFNRVKNDDLTRSRMEAAFGGVLG